VHEASFEPDNCCPYCTAPLKTQGLCNECNRSFEAGFDHAAALNRLQRKEEWAAGMDAAGTDPQVPSGVLRRIRPRTLMLLAGTILLAIAAVACLKLDLNDAMAVAGMTCVLFSGMLGIGFLHGLVNDMLTPSFYDRRTPERGLYAFLHALCQKRYDFSYACLLPPDKDQHERIAPVLWSGLEAAEATNFSEASGFEWYWNKVLSGHGEPKVGNLKVVREEGPYALVSTHMLYPSSRGAFGDLMLGVAGFIVIRGSEARIRVSKLMRRIKDQWYVVSGDLESPEDKMFSRAAELPTVAGDDS